MDTREQPIAVDARMPVEATIEQRMQSPRTLYVRGVDHHVVHFVGIFARHVRQHHPGKQRCHFGSQSLWHDLAPHFCTDRTKLQVGRKDGTLRITSVGTLLGGGLKRAAAAREEYLPTMPSRGSTLQTRGDIDGQALDSSKHDYRL